MGPSHDFIYFLHIPKTGGTTLHRFLTERGGGPDRVTGQLIWDNIARGESPITEATTVVVGHFGGLLPLWYGRWPRLLTLIREPVARSLSHINHVRRDPGHPLHARARGLDVVDYCADPILRLTISDFQARYVASLSFARVLLRPSPAEPLPNGMAVAFETALYSLDGAIGLESAALAMIDEMEAVGVTDQMEASTAVFAKVLGWRPPDAIEPLNLAEADQQALKDLSADEWEALRANTTIDRALYARSCERLAELREIHGI